MHSMVKLATATVVQTLVFYKHCSDMVVKKPRRTLGVCNAHELAAYMVWYPPTVGNSCNLSTRPGREVA